MGGRWSGRGGAGEAARFARKSSLIICKTLTGKKRLSRNLREQNSIRIKLLRDEWWRGESGNNKFKSVHLQAGELMQESGREKLTGGICYKYRIWDFPTYGVFWPVLDFSWALLHFDMWNRVWQTRKSTKHFSSQTKVPFSSPTQSTFCTPRKCFCPSKVSTYTNKELSTLILYFQNTFSQIQLVFLPLFALAFVYLSNEDIVHKFETPLWCSKSGGGAAAVFTPIFCRLPPHKGKYVCPPK